MRMVSNFSNITLLNIFIQHHNTKHEMFTFESVILLCLFYVTRLFPMTLKRNKLSQFHVIMYVEMCYHNLGLCFSNLQLHVPKVDF